MATPVIPKLPGYHIGDILSVLDTGGALQAADTISLTIFNGSEFSDVIATATSDGSGAVTFSNFVVPLFPFGRGYQFILEDTALTQVASDDVFALMPPRASARRLRPGRPGANRPGQTRF
jgi:hypothetical protein